MHLLLVLFAYLQTIVFRYARDNNVAAELPLMCVLDASEELLRQGDQEARCQRLDVVHREDELLRCLPAEATVQQLPTLNSWA